MHLPVVVPNRESELVETDAAVACLLAAQVDELFIPGVEKTVYFDVQHFPS